MALSWHPSALGRSLGASWACLGAVLRLSWACLGLSYGIILAPLGARAILGRVLGVSWCCFEAVLGLFWAVLRHYPGPPWHKRDPWTRLEPVLVLFCGCLGLVLGCLTALSWHPSALARSLGASWACLGAILRLSWPSLGLSYGIILAPLGTRAT